MRAAHVIWLAVAVASTMAVAPESVAAQCLQCEMCPGTEHQNVPCPWCFIGSSGGEHEECWSLSCGSTHEQTVDCTGSYAALGALRALPVLREYEARRIEAQYSDRVAYSPSGKYLQVYDCRAERVVAQFPIVT